MTKITLKVSRETHQQLKKAQAILSGEHGKLLTLDETIKKLCEEVKK